MEINVLKDTASQKSESSIRKEDNDLYPDPERNPEAFQKKWTLLEKTREDIRVWSRICSRQRAREEGLEEPSEWIDELTGEIFYIPADMWTNQNSSFIIK